MNAQQTSAQRRTPRPVILVDPRLSMARRHAQGLRRHLEELGLVGEAAVTRTLVEIMEGRWS